MTSAELISDFGRINNFISLRNFFRSLCADLCPSFSVTKYGPEVDDCCADDEGVDLVGDAGECSSADEDGAYGVYKIVDGVEDGGLLCPIRHGANGCEKAAEQEEANHKKPHYHYGLLHCLVVVRNDESKSTEDERK